MASMHGQASSMNVERNKLSSQVDRVVGLIETCCTVHVMSKIQAAIYLFLLHDIEPTLTETVWNELERQNPEFFKDYNIKRAVRNQTDMHNILYLALINAMPGNLHNVTVDYISGGASMSTEMPHETNGVANSHGHDPACGTSTQVIDPNNMQHDMGPSASDTYPSSERVCDIDNGDHLCMMDLSTSKHHWMNESARILHGMNLQATRVSGVQGSVSTLAGVPHEMNGVVNHVPVRDPMSGGASMSTEMPRETNGVANSHGHDPACGTSTQVIDPNNMQHDMVPSASDTYRTSSERVCDIDNGDHLFMMDLSTPKHHWMNESARILHEMNLQATHISGVQGSVSTLAGVPHGMNGVVNHVPVRDPMCNTSIQVSNPNNMQRGVFPSTSRISENQDAYDIHNSFPAFTMDSSARAPYGTHKQLDFQ